MNYQERLQIDHECRMVLFAFAWGLDSSDAEAAANAFCEDGVWEREGRSLQGRDRIRESVAARPAGLLTRHMLTNTVINVVDADNAEGRSYYLVFRHTAPDDDAEKRPRLLEGVKRAGDYVTRFRRTPEGWRIVYNATVRHYEIETP